MITVNEDRTVMQIIPYSQKARPLGKKKAICHAKIN